MNLECLECGHVVHLDADAQKKILAELKRPAEVRVIDCPRCARFQWGLAARVIRRCAA